MKKRNVSIYLASLTPSSARYSRFPTWYPSASRPPSLPLTAYSIRVNLSMCGLPHQFLLFPYLISTSISKSPRRVDETSV
jgi:hypothetical protein